MPPRVLDGRYQVDAQLGAGGQGRVFRGRDLTTKRVLALKLMEEGTEDDPELLARFVQEGRLAARIRDPHLLAALHFGISDGQRYIVYDYIPGAAPVTTLVEEGRMEPSVVCDIALQLLDVLSTLHKADIVHQDIAEENILWCRRPSGRTEVFLIDLGSASSTISGGLRPARSPVGHDSFMAPEMGRDGGICDHRVDLWSVGALMYVLLTGRYVDIGTFEEPLEIPPPSLLMPSLPRPLSDVVMHALEKCEERFASAADMIAAIHALELPAVPMPPPPRGGRGLSVWAGVGGMVLTAVFAVLGTAWALRAATTSPTVHASRPAPAAITPSTASPPPTLSGVPSPTVSPTRGSASANLPPMREALGQIADELRRCSSLAGGLLVVEFTAAEGDDHAAVAIDSSAPDVERCVHDATASLRFRPQGPLKLSEEYMP